MNREEKQCRNCHNPFFVEPDDFTFYAKMGVPAPTLCPECRFRRKMAFRNEITLYNRHCELCSRSVVSMFNPDSPYIIYCTDCWVSDKWDPYAYAQDYDPNRPFFEQLKELTIKVPKFATFSSSSLAPNINSEYTNFSGGNKDCYLLFNSGPNNENCAYSRGVGSARDVFDCYYGDGLEHTYEGVNIHKSFRLVWCQNTLDSLDSWLLSNCAGCNDCFGCVNLRHKTNYFFNEPLSKDEYTRRINEIRGSYSKLEAVKKRFAEHLLKYPQRATQNLRSQNCSGNFIFDAKDCLNCFEISSCENIKHAFSVKLGKDCYDVIGHCRKSELLLEDVAVGSSASHVISSWSVENSHDVEYSFATRASEYCFGCDGIKGGKYAILNKRYDEKEYKELRAKIVAELKSQNEYGLFMPPVLAPFGYNETVGQDNLPLTKDEALAQGFSWQENKQLTKGRETLKPNGIPDHIKDVTDSILNEVLACITCDRNYRLIKPELDFYRQMLIPVPRQCFHCRHSDRLRRRGPMTIYDRTCAKCSQAIKTNFAPDRPEIVWCETCYTNEVV